MADTYDVSVKRMKVYHDGLSMVVLKPGGKNPPVKAEHIAQLVEEGFIDKPKGWKPTPATSADGTAVSDGGVLGAPPAPAEPVTTDLVRGLNVDLRSLQLADLMQIALAEGIVTQEENDAAARHLIEAIEAKREASEPDPFDHDGDGKPGGDKADDVVDNETAGFTLTEVGGGWWHIAGPGLDEPVKVRGEEDAKDRYAAMVNEALAKGDGDEGQAPA